MFEFTDEQTNFEVLQNELVQLDVMTANRDRVVWAAASGESIQPDDSNVPEPVEVISNLGEPQFQEHSQALAEDQNRSQWHFFRPWHADQARSKTVSTMHTLNYSKCRIF